MLACELWYRVDYLHRHGHTIRTLPDGTRVAQGRQTYPLPPHCGHQDCPNPMRPNVLDATRCAASERSPK